LAIQPSFIALFLRFLMSGGLATGIHWLVMWEMLELQFDATISTAVGATCGAAINYILQYYHAFRCKERHSVVLQNYILGCGIGWIANLVLFFLFFNFLLPSAAGAQLLTTGLVTCLNFYLYRKVVFYDYHRE
jgi:putative flippase GtrA